MKLQRLLSLVRQAVDDYTLIDDQDHIAVGVSGGKDSLALLYALHELQRFYPKHFTLHAFTVDLGFGIQDFSGIKAFCEGFQVPLTIIPTEIGKIVFAVVFNVRRTFLYIPAKDIFGPHRAYCDPPSHVCL